MTDTAASEAAAAPLPLLRRRRVIIIVGLLLLIAATVLAVVQYRHDQAAERERVELEEWMRKQKGLPPSGGKIFAPRVVIPVPVFAQSDDRWGGDALGTGSAGRFRAWELSARGSTPSNGSSSVSRCGPSSEQGCDKWAT